jgi:hypothetical protein
MTLDEEKKLQPQTCMKKMKAKFVNSKRNIKLFVTILNILLFSMCQIFSKFGYQIIVKGQTKCKKQFNGNTICFAVSVIFMTIVLVN